MTWSRTRIGRNALALVLSSVMVVALAGVALADSDVHIVASFNEAQGQNPEGIAVGRTGTIYVSVSPLGDVWRFAPGADDPQPFAHVDGIVPGRDFGLLGLAIDVFGNVYGGVQSANPAANGVWRFDRWTGDATKLPGTAEMGIPNGLAFDKQMNLYVTDSARGAIWRIPWGGTASIWLQDAKLTGDFSLGLGLGANGIAIQRGVLTVTNTERRTILRIPKIGGHAGAIAVVTTLPTGDNPDGVALDVFGNAYVCFNLANTVARIAPDGAMSVVASGEPLDFPSSVAFGTSHGQRSTLYGVNFSISELFGLPAGSGPGVFSTQVGAPGMPIP
jgi:sugar lactone lactonase YvrE